MDDPERLSSLQTAFYKRVFPILAFSGFGIAAATLWFGPPETLKEAPEWFKYAAIAAWLAGSLGLHLLMRPLRTVWLDGDHLVTGEGQEARRIPLRLVAEVSETRFMNPKVIKVRLQPRAGIPAELRFLAPAAIYMPLTDHPIVRRLRGAVAEAQRKG